jgi:hypothetical protein
MKANATQIDTLLYTKESRKSRAQAEADLSAEDPTPERATAILKGMSPAPVSRANHKDQANEQEVPQGVRPEDVDPGQ